ncbi:Calponin [Carpediemonas membranifera]|uniref:Calponin n=1 Tax=Carpediemonas membranifera TaxID=201153 RepID=A0A8J6E136_9EUKA|nr:Calponin [Carpediemonas membranifera]|eukprot:KAG9390127.1 Calponin [Carpediemonas membranifera]
MVRDDSTDAAILVWINSFIEDEQVTDINELIDGVILFKVVSQIIPKYCSKQDAQVQNPGGQWVLGLKNLKLIVSLIEGYHMTMDVEMDLSFVDTAVIARQQDPGLVRDHLIFLIEAVLFTAVHCDRSQQFIGTILDLPEHTQDCLMHLIQDMDLRVGDRGSPHKASNSSSHAARPARLMSTGQLQAPPSVAPTPGPVYEPTATVFDEDKEKLAKQVEAFRAQVAQLEAANKELDFERTQLNTELDAASMNREALERSMRARQSMVIATTEQKYQSLQNEVDKIHEKLYNATTRANDAEAQLKAARSEAETFRRQVDTQAGRIESLTISLHKAEASATDKERQIAALKTSVAKLDEMNEQLAAELQTPTEASDEITRRVADLEDQLEQAHTAAVLNEKEIARWQQKARDAEDRAEVSEQSCEAVQVRLASVTTEIQELYERNTELQTRATQEDVMARVEKRIAAVSELKMRTGTELATELKLTQERLGRATARADEAIATIAQERGRIAELEDVIADLNREIEGKNAVIERLGDERLSQPAQELATRVSELEERLAAALEGAAQAEVYRARLAEVRAAVDTDTLSTVTKLTELLDRGVPTVAPISTGGSTDAMAVQLETTRAELRDTTQRLYKAEEAKDQLAQEVSELRAVKEAKSERTFVEATESAKTQSRVHELEAELERVKAEAQARLQRAARGANKRDIEETLKITAFASIGMQLQQVVQEKEKLEEEYRYETARLRRIIAVTRGDKG